MNINSNFANAIAAAQDNLLGNITAKDPGIIYKTPHYHGFCHSCCHPAHQCCCNVRSCRKEPKELLVVPVTKGTSGAGTLSDARTGGTLELLDGALKESSLATGMLNLTENTGTPAADVALNPRVTVTSGRGMAIIGGCCCAHLSIEYMPAISRSDATTNPNVLVYVVDSESTLLSWGKTIRPESVYQIKENIIATKPGAELIVIVTNMVARIRWCEIFSC